ncbi:uncharacterized protein LOC124425897 [Vespa crabro]|uniref:uncharacterized protein LOC124425897 n=1 Tax=Vespa crabro TaxID=7445 RepID=UPI001F002EA0|nr:uncharacterized protein LOC124425897 [Vespa crabro]
MSNMKNYRKNGGGKRPQKKTESKEKPQLLVQPKQSYAEYDNNAKIDDKSKDFESFINQPISMDGQFVFKCEKNWSADVLGCFDYFTLDLNLLSAAMRCIPFNECVKIKDEYFTADQLTSFYNAVEEGKEIYNDILSNLEISSSSNTMNFNKSLDRESKEKLEMNLNLQKSMTDNKTFEAQIEDKSDDSDTEESLDFLLSLKSSTLQSNKKQMASTDVFSKNELKTQSATLSTKPIDLEIWLDKILDD